MKNKMYKLAVIAMIAVCFVVLCSCGKEKSNNTGIVQKDNDDTDGVQKEKIIWYLGDNDSFSKDVDFETLFEEVEDTVNPDSIYKSLNLTEKMIRGVYTLNNKEKDLKKVREEIPFEEVKFGENAFNMTTLPVAVYLGKENIGDSGIGYEFAEYRKVTDYEVAVIEFATEDKVVQVSCIYEINNNIIIFKEIIETSSGEKDFSYEFTGIEFSYDIGITGPYLTFSKDNSSITLKAFCFTENTDHSLCMHGYSLPDSPLVNDLDYFSSADAWTYAVKRDGSYYDFSAYKLDDEGRFTLYLEENDSVSEETKEFMNQYAYIVQSSASSYRTDFSIILFDGSKEYYYTDDVTDREARALEEQGVDVTAIDENVIKEIAEKKSDLYDDLNKEFETNGINAVINRSIGEIALDAAVLFDVNEAVISDEGKKLLQDFMKVFSSVVFNDKYKDFISKIMVEGHTDTDGSYELNQELSKERADSVKKYCLSEECVVDSAYKAVSKDMFETIGYAYDKPIYDKDGEVDKEASRRVSFRLCVKVD